MIKTIRSLFPTRRKDIDHILLELRNHAAATGKSPSEAVQARLRAMKTYQRTQSRAKALSSGMGAV